MTAQLLNSGGRALDRQDPRLPGSRRPAANGTSTGGCGIPSTPPAPNATLTGLANIAR